MEALEIATQWNTVRGTEEEKKLPTMNVIIGIFTSNKVSEEDIKKHCNQV